MAFMLNRRAALGAFAGVALSGLALGGAPALAQEFPSKTITLVSPFDPGGQSDLTARFVAEMAREILGVPVVVENRPGGGGAVGLASVAKSAPDGYTIAQYTSSPLLIRPLVADVAYDPTKDFTQLGRMMVLHSPLAVRSDSPFQTLQELIDWARANPGKLRWAAGASMGAAHLSTQVLFQSEKLQTTFIPTSGGVETQTQLMSGQYEVASMTNFVEGVRDNTIRLLAESGPVSPSVAPDVKTYEQLGYPLTLPVYLGFVAPAGLPEDVAKKWHDVMDQIAKSERFAQYVASQNASPYYMSGPEFAEAFPKEFENTKAVLTQFGLAKK